MLDNRRLYRDNVRNRLYSLKHLAYGQSETPDPTIRQYYFVGDDAHIVPFSYGLHKTKRADAGHRTLQAKQYYHTVGAHTVRPLFISRSHREHIERAGRVYRIAERQYIESRKRYIARPLRGRRYFSLFHPSVNTPPVICG